jgi:uncharacterized protein YjiS (DUF1127 family)
MAILLNLRGHAPNAAGAAADDPANGERDRPDQQQRAASWQPVGDVWQGITLQSFNVALHPGLQRPASAIEPRATSRFVRLVFWSRSTITAGMQAVARQWRASRTVAALERLDDATLKDLGICRCEIEYLARTRPSARWRA